MDMWFIGLCLVCTFSATQAVDVEEAGPPQANLAVENERLLDHLWRQSSVARRNTPPADESNIVVVQYGIGLIEVRDLDVETGVADLLTWERFTWTDGRLRWNPEDYGGLDTLRVPVSMIWQPDLKTYNSFNANEAESRADALAVVFSSGELLYIPPSEKKIRCTMSDDESLASCTMKIGSWTYDGLRVDIAFYNGIESVDITDFKTSPQVSGIANNTAVKAVKYYPCCVEPFPSLNFSFDIVRGSG